MGKSASTIAAPESSGKVSQADIDDFRSAMLRWYDRGRRDLPWRASKGAADPYKVWLSEIMLQQTVVAAAIPYFLKFTEKWPTVQALAAAPEEEVMDAWAGLGYYARCRNLHRCARIVAGEMGGRFPEKAEDLKKLPGIGDYTAAAVSSIAFQQPCLGVDGNVERVLARFFAVDAPLPQGKKKIGELALGLSKDRTDRPGDFAQALMDLGATVCSPAKPKCAACPLGQSCQAYRNGNPASYPVRSTSTAKPVKYGYIYWVCNERGQILLERRRPGGLLGGMNGFPTSDWLKAENDVNPPAILLNHKEKICFVDSATVNHVFTHFSLILRMARLSGNHDIAPENSGFYWCDRQNLEKKAFPSVFRKFFNLMMDF